MEEEVVELNSSNNGKVGVLDSAYRWLEVSSVGRTIQSPRVQVFLSIQLWPLGMWSWLLPFLILLLLLVTIMLPLSPYKQHTRYFYSYGWIFKSCKGARKFKLLWKWDSGYNRIKIKKNNCSQQSLLPPHCVYGFV